MRVPLGGPLVHVLYRRTADRTVRLLLHKRPEEDHSRRKLPRNGDCSCGWDLLVSCALRVRIPLRPGRAAVQEKGYAADATSHYGRRSQPGCNAYATAWYGDCHRDADAADGGDCHRDANAADGGDCHRDADAADGGDCHCHGHAHGTASGRNGDCHAHGTASGRNGDCHAHGTASGRNGDCHAHGTTGGRNGDRHANAMNGDEAKANKTTVGRAQCVKS
jgi:hypothetical protein